MSIMMMGSLHTYASNMKMQMKWEQKKSKGDYSADGTTSIAEQLRKEAGGIGAASNRSKQAVLNGIRSKLNAGKRLSSSELEYLKKNDPETYQHVKAMEMERKAYEQRLKNCKTKEEVQRLKASQMASSLDRVREVNNNPNIPDGEKLKLTMQEHQKVSSVTDATTKFAQSGEYSKLPTEAEKRKAEKDLKEAKEAEMKGETKDQKDTAVDEKDSEDSQVQTEQTSTDQDKTTDSPSSDTPSAAAHTAEAAAKADPAPLSSARKDAALSASQKSADAELAKARELLLASKKTRVEAELTPEAQKVRRSKAKSAYVQNMYTGESASISTIDIQS